LRTVYDALAFSFLSRRNLTFFESNIELFSRHVEVETLASAIVDGYARAKSPSHEDLLWLLAHFVSLGDVAHDFVQRATYLEALYVQLTALSKDIGPQLGGSQSSDPLADKTDEPPNPQYLDPFIQKQLLSLVSPDAISRLLRHLPGALESSSSRQFQETSLLAGYISTLLACFPSQADEIRMRLFLEAIPSHDGEITTVRLFWQSVRQSALFKKLYSQSQPPEDVLREYAQAAAHPSKTSPDDQQWRVIIIFLELYIFVLRLSDDEDFLRGTKPRLGSESSSTSRLQASSLSLEDLELLTSALKNAAFALHYKSHYISKSQADARIMVNSRLGSYLGSSPSAPGMAKSKSEGLSVPYLSTKLDITSLKDLITTAMKMLYERDSRKHFLPTGHWLMTDKLDREDFISAVIAEDERQREEDDGDESDADDEDFDPSEFLLSGQGLGMSRRNHNTGLQRVRRNQHKMLRERRLAEMGPKLEVLKHMPFVVPFETRVKIFRQFITLDRFKRDAMNPRAVLNFDLISPHGSRHHAHIRRDRLFEDAYDNFYKLGEGLKDSINITFVDQFGSPEAGIDGGGVTKEFLTSVTTEAFGGSDDSLRMFASSETGLLYPNPIAVDNSREVLRRQGLTEGSAEWRELMGALLKRYEFLGRVVGKCLYEGILVDLAFAGFFLLQWPSTGSTEGNTYKGSVNDLSDMDEDLYKGMLRLKNYPGDVSALGIDFTITDQVSLPHEPPKTITRNLIPNGDKIAVTNDNRLLYISYVARHRLVLQPALQTTAFLRGLREIIRPSWLSMFNQSELQHLVGGDSSEIDIEDLRRNTVYGGLYEIGDDGEEHPTVKLFWKVMGTFNDSQRRDVLKYVSSTPRAPLLGFSQLRPKFSIRDAGSNEQRLPSTSTCVNLLKLPLYKSEAALREKLLYAISSGAGFDLS
jgi:ubiquitin-protein ligase E3 C